MKPRKRTLLFLFASAALSGGLLLAMPTLLEDAAPGVGPMIALAGALAAAGVQALAALSLERGLFRPLADLGRDIQALARSRRIERPPAMPALDILEPLAAPVTELVEQLAAGRRAFDEALGQATQRINEQKSWLEVILLDLSEGVVVCSMAHQILLYNQAAMRLLGRPETVGLNRNLFTLVTRQPVLHALDLVELRRKSGEIAASSISFVCATADARALLQGRLALIAGPDRMPTGYVVTFADVGREIAALARDDSIRRALTRELRGPLANLRAAAETLAGFPGMAVEQRAAFDKVVQEESAKLSARIEALDAEFRNQAGARWLMADIHSLDLFNCLARALAHAGGVRLTMVGIPLWLHGDSHSLLLALEALVRRIRDFTGSASLDVEAKLGDRRVYVDLIWHGDPVPSSTLDSWLLEPLEGLPGGLSAGDVLERHGTEPWSQRLRDGVSLLRLPLPAPTRPQFAETEPPPPPRPEFYDFDLISAHSDTGALGNRPLAELTYVVFDTETTGLNPTQGDRIVQIGAVRVVNRRILTGETFERLVDPGRPIPPASTHFHGITDDMVRGKPPIEIVMPQFSGFAGDAVLVAHNAAFDLKFLQTCEVETGVSFSNPVLDTLLIAALVDPEGDHSLDNLARRLGIETHRRHSALADALVTAEVLVRLFDLLEAKGIHTFDEAMRASSMTAQLRIRGMRF